MARVLRFDPEPYPVLPLRDLVVFPGMIVPLFVGRQKSVKALELAAAVGNRMMLVAQKSSNNEDPKPDELYKVGVVGGILQVITLQDNTLKILVEGQQRVQVAKYDSTNGVLKAFVRPIHDAIEVTEDEISMLRRSVMEQFYHYAQLNTKINPDVIGSLNSVSDISKFADVISAHLFLKVANKQELLESTSVSKKLEKIIGFIQLEIEMMNTEQKIRTRVRTQIEKNQKDYYLNEQLKAIHRELGEEDYKEEVTRLAQKIAALKLSAEAKERSESELKKLKFMNPMSSEAAIVRNYLDWVINLPWQEYSKLNKNIKKAEAVLDRDHFGLEKIKERILEYLAVNLRTNKLKSPIICLIGPPGVGKTSLAKSIAASTGREFVKVSLGGLRDEAEIKGHRRTYIGSMPGKILQAIRKSKKSNPVMLLDEIDKMSFDYRGDPASAMLEVLDPEQNHIFNDHYLELDYDLSQVMFVATANSFEGIPRPLMDRMEIIRLSGYTEEEKIAITEKYLIPKQIEAHGIKPRELVITRDAVVEIIRYYTREAGMRNMDRNIAKLARKAIKEIMLNKKTKIKITAKQIEKYLGVRKYNFGEVEPNNLVGITTGLAYSEVGGDLLAIEAVVLYGKGGEVKITGKLGEVMKESVQAALSYIRSRATDYGIKPSIFKNKDIHVHVPEGATPKDGPSAGIAMCTSIVSALTGIPVRKDIAMTGEVTLRGRVLPIGGLKEKLLAALRGGVKKVLIPKDNYKDLEEIPDNVKEGIELVAVETVDEVLKHALERKLVPIIWSEEDEFTKDNSSINRIGMRPN